MPRMDSGDDEFNIKDSLEVRALKARLTELREEHRTLDNDIAAMTAGGDMIQIARLKKQKLVLKDQIQWLEDRLTPDIIA
jgi:hypothetical protein